MSQAPSVLVIIIVIIVVIIIAVGMDHARRGVKSFNMGFVHDRPYYRYNPR